MALTLDIDNQRRDEPRVDEKHYHVWIDTGQLAMLAQPPRFRTRQAGRQCGIHSGIPKDRLHVFKCGPGVCRFAVPRRRKRKRRRNVAA